MHAFKLALFCMNFSGRVTNNKIHLSNPTNSLVKVILLPQPIQQFAWCWTLEWRKFPLHQQLRRMVWRNKVCYLAAFQLWMVMTTFRICERLLKIWFVLQGSWKRLCSRVTWRLLQTAQVVKYVIWARLSLCQVSWIYFKVVRAQRR